MTGPRRQDPLPPGGPSVKPTAEPAPRRAEAPSAPREGPGRREGPARREEKTAGLLGPVLAALVLGLVVGGFATSRLDRGSTEDDPFGGALDSARHQAVILSNDKVYFGRLSSHSDDFYRLSDAFFLRETRESPEAEPVRALLPVNREIHAPENSMLIRKDEVVLVENLDKDSPILTEIRRQQGGR